MHKPIITIIGMTVVSAFLAGCQSNAPGLQEGMPVEQAAGIGKPRSPSLQVINKAEVGPRDKYRKQLITEPRVQAVYVVEHVDEELDVKVGGHFVYFWLDKGGWALPGRRSNTPPESFDNFEAISDPTVVPGLRRAFKDRNWIIPLAADELGTSNPQEEKDHERNR